MSSSNSLVEMYDETQNDEKEKEKIIENIASLKEKMSSIQEDILEHEARIDEINSRRTRFINMLLAIETNGNGINGTPVTPTPSTDAQERGEREIQQTFNSLLDKTITAQFVRENRPRPPSFTPNIDTQFYDVLQTIKEVREISSEDLRILTEIGKNSLSPQLTNLRKGEFITTRRGLDGSTIHTFVSDVGYDPRIEATDKILEKVIQAIEVIIRSGDSLTKSRICSVSGVKKPKTTLAIRDLENSGLLKKAARGNYKKTQKWINEQGAE
jgi:predicted transcriptional regulator